MKLKDLTGKLAVDFSGNVGNILNAVYVKDYDLIKKYDSTDWMNEAKDVFLDDFDPNTTIIVAFEIESGETIVDMYGENGIETTDDLNKRLL